MRNPLTRAERERGRLLGELLRQARGERSTAEVAAAAGLSAETVRKIEAGRIPTPAFFTVTALASALGLSLDRLAQACQAAAPAAGEPAQARAARVVPPAHGTSVRTTPGAAPSLG